MAAYMTYWPGEQLRALKKAGDTGPIRVVLGSIHTKMPSIDSVQVGDVTNQAFMDKLNAAAAALLRERFCIFKILFTHFFICI